MHNFTAPSRLVVTGRLLLPTGEHWLVERERPGTTLAVLFRLFPILKALLKATFPAQYLH